MTTPSYEQQLAERVRRENEERAAREQAELVEEQKAQNSPAVQEYNKEVQGIKDQASGKPAASGAKPAQGGSQNQRGGGQSKPQQQAAAPQQAQNAQPTTATEQSPGQRGLQEVGTALVGGAIDAVEGIGANAEAALTGQLNNPDFDPTWLQLPDDIEPQNKTWWGKVARDLVQYTALGIGLRKGAGKINTAPTKFIAGKGSTFQGMAVREGVRGAIISNIGTQSTEDNLTAQLTEVIPWIPTKFLATEESDSPITRRFKNTLEAAGFDFVFDRVLGFVQARRVARNVETTQANESLRKVAIESGEYTRELKAENDILKNLREGRKQLRAELGIAKTAAEEAKGTPNEAAILAELQAKQDSLKQLEAVMKEKRTKIKDLSGKDPIEIAEQAGREAEEQSRKQRDTTLTENATHRYEEGRLDEGPDPFASHPDLFDAPERSHFSNNPNLREAVNESLFNAMRVDLDVRQALGRVGNILTEAKYEKILKGGTPAVRKVLDEAIEEMMNDRDFALEINGRKYSKQDSINLVASKAYDAMKVTENPDDIDALKELLLTNPDSGSIAGETYKYLNRESTAATQLLIRVTAEELADLSNVIRSYDATKVVDTEHLEGMLMTRLEFLLKEHKKAAYMRGSGLASMRQNWVRTLMPGKVDYETRFKEIDEEVGEVMNTLKGTAAAEDKRLLKHFISMASISDGNVRTMDDLARYMQSKIRLNGWLMGSPEEQNYLLRGLTAQFFNSVLSSPKTVMRAWIGTGLATALRPLTLGLGGALRGDQRLMAKSLAQTNAIREGFDEALAMLTKSHNAWIGGNQSVNDTMIGSRVAFHKTKEFKALEEWAELKGTDGDKGAVRLAATFSRVNDHWAVNYSQGLMDMGDSFFRTLIGRMELKGRAFDEAWAQSGGKVGPELVRRYEDKFHSLIFGSDGLVTDAAAKMAGDEATLTTPLEGIGQDIDRLIQSIPAIKAFILFPRTAMNAMRLTATYTPMLNGWVKEVGEVMNATPATAPRIMAKYGITDLAATQAMYEGRVALGQAVVAAAGWAYVSGKITGNGPFDKQQREADIQAGWQPRSIKVGDKWVAYDGLEPFHTFLALVADIGDSTNELGSSITEDWFERIAYVFAQNVTNKSFLSGLGTLMEVISGQGGNRLTTVSANLANNILPYAGLRNATANAFSPAMRELSDSFHEKFMNRNPILREELPRKFDVFTGKPVRGYEPLTRFFNAVSPISINPDWSETREELRRSGYDLKNAFTTDPDTSQRLDPKVISAMQQEMSTYNLEAQLERFFQTKEYRQSRDLLQAARDRGQPNATIRASDTFHFKKIDMIFKDAKRRALMKVRNEIGETEAVRQALTRKKIGASGAQGDFNAQQFYLDQQRNIR